MDVDVEVLKLATASTGVSVEGSSDVGITYKGAKKLAFGVELMELAFDAESGAVKLSIPDEAVTVRSGDAASIGPVTRESSGADSYAPLRGDQPFSLWRERSRQR